MTQLDGLDINAWLVQYGCALAYRKYSTRYVDEEEAKALKRGIWSGTFTTPWEWRKGTQIPSDKAENDQLKETR